MPQLPNAPSKKNFPPSDEFSNIGNPMDMAGFDSPPPRYHQNEDDSFSPKFNPPPKQQTPKGFQHDDLGLPSVPDDLPTSSSGNDSFDYDDLTKRFNNLKSTKK